jgi:chaperonin GroES
VVTVDLALDGIGCQLAGRRVGTRDDVPSTADPDHHGRPTGRPPMSRKRGQHVAVSIKPLEDRIVVQTLEAEQTTASGLVIPDTAKEKPQEGKVLAVGPGRFDEDGEKRIPLDVQVGDTVLYSKYGGTEIKYGGEEYLILSARDVLAVIEK